MRIIISILLIIFVILFSDTKALVKKHYDNVETLLDSVAMWYPTFMDTFACSDTYDEYLESREHLERTLNIKRNN